MFILPCSGYAAMPDETCPKCGYQRQLSDRHVMAGVCPACGIAYRKWQAAQQARCAAPPIPVAPLELELVPLETAAAEPEAAPSRRLLAVLGEIPAHVDGQRFLGRLVLMTVLFCWGLSFIFGGIDWRSINGSFMHNINLPFHEFGHVLFRPFGEFMTILGGSLFQVLLPLLLMLAFLLKPLIGQDRDTFGAAVMLWWTGQSLIDVSPYIEDAPYRALPLIGGNEDFHDWGNLLGMTGHLGDALSIARTSFTFGSLLILLSGLWSAWLLLRYWRQLSLQGD